VAYNNIVSRTNTQSLIPEVVSNDILNGLTNQSAALTLFRQVRMATNQTRMPVLSALPTAYFVSGDTGLKQTTEAAWSNKYLNVEELAAIVPIAEAVLDDAQFDVWGSIMPLLTDAIARVLDAAVIFGTNKPASWGGALVADATIAGNVVNRSVGTPRTDKAGLSGYFSTRLR
jgi:HK97 family phage major capsid protein